MRDLSPGLHFEAVDTHETPEGPYCVFRLHVPALNLYLRLAYSEDGLGIEPLPSCCKNGLTKKTLGVEGFWICADCDQTYPMDSPTMWRGGARDYAFMFPVEESLTEWLESILAKAPASLTVFDAALAAIELEHHIMAFSGGRDCLTGEYVSWWVTFQSEEEMEQRARAYQV